MIKKFGWFAAMFSAVVLMSVSLSSCSEDDPNNPKDLDSYYVECTDLSSNAKDENGDDMFSAQDLAEIKADMNAELVQDTWADITKTEAEAAFTLVMNNLVKEYDPADYDFLKEGENITMVFALKKVDGKKVKEQKVVYTATKCELK